MKGAVEADYPDKSKIGGDPRSTEAQLVSMANRIHILVLFLDNFLVIK